jgi:hypothetical protein
LGSGTSVIVVHKLDAYLVGIDIEVLGVCLSGRAMSQGTSRVGELNTSLFLEWD